MLFCLYHKCLITKQRFSIFMDSEYFDEECLLKVLKATKLSGEILTLTWNWNNFSNPIKDAHEVMDKVQKLFSEIFEYEQRMGSKLSKYQINKIDNAIVELRKAIPHMENKIKPSESLEIGT